MDSACWMELWQGALYLKTLLTTKGNSQQAVLGPRSFALRLENEGIPRGFCK